MRVAMRFVLPLVLLAASPLAADSVIEEIVARINNEIISRSDFRRSSEQLRAEITQQNPAEGAQQFAEREPDILRDLIDQSLLVQRGKDLGMSADTEVIKRLDEIRKQLNLETMEDLEKAAAAQGVSYEDFKQNIRSNIITQQVISREVGSRIQITQDEVRKYYEEHQAQMTRPEQVRLSEILVSTQSGDESATPSAEALAAAQSKAAQLLEQIRKGAAFEDVAKASSDGPTAAQGGDLGYFEHGKLAAELEKLTFAMQPGELSDVIRTRQGYIILKVTEHAVPGVPPLKSVEGRIFEALYYIKLQPSMRTYLTKLREEAYIDVKEGYVDTGASPNQTKPILTSSVVEEEKKKKKKKFLIF